MTYFLSSHIKINNMGSDKVKHDASLMSCIYTHLNHLYINKLPFSFLRFSHFISKLKTFISGSLWFEFYCHFGRKMKSSYICLIKSFHFVIFFGGKIIILIFIKNLKNIFN
ncbi:hypothetical protein Hanom_Chr08g00733451 [Helianthus anomalus]